MRRIVSLWLKQVFSLGWFPRAAMAAGDSRARGCVAYERAWRELNPSLREALQRVGADRPGVLAHLVDLEGRGPDEVLDGCVEAVAEMLKLPSDSVSVLDDAADL